MRRVETSAAGAVVTAVTLSVAPSSTTMRAPQAAYTRLLAGFTASAGGLAEVSRTRTTREAFVAPSITRSAVVPFLLATYARLVTVFTTIGPVELAPGKATLVTTPESRSTTLAPIQSLPQ